MITDWLILDGLILDGFWLLKSVCLLMLFLELCQNILCWIIALIQTQQYNGILIRHFFKKDPTRKMKYFLEALCQIKLDFKK